MTFVYAIGFASFLLVLWLANGVRRIGAVSQGEKIGNRDGSALLLIDLQTIFWDSGTYAAAAKDAAQTAILNEVQAARAQGRPVIAVRQEWSIPSTKAIARLAMKGQAIAGSAGTDLAKPFASLADHVLVKPVQDAFVTGELDALLARLNIGTLVIAGLDFNYCVQKTALAARNRGYEVTVLKSGSLASAPTEEAEKRMCEAGIVIR
ncbi:cysteine hydrolase family protein [Thioclava sp. FR2]|uniref:cysteine hydrolase family protein n=1 Tax=Thioclava sp. FR2 TaxID=3445780 RepID=UPI003EC0EFAA